jgi:hypothetical protein
MIHARHNDCLVGCLVAWLLGCLECTKTLYDSKLIDLLEMLLDDEMWKCFRLLVWNFLIGNLEGLKIDGRII